MNELVEKIGFLAAIALPLWNIPLILHMIKRKSSRDISMHWVVGVWTCIVLMVPSGLKSADLVWKTFNIMNLILFSGVLIIALKYRRS